MFCIDLRLLKAALSLVHGEMDGWMEGQRMDFYDYRAVLDFVPDG